MTETRLNPCSFCGAFPKIVSAAKGSQAFRHMLLHTSCPHRIVIYHDSTKILTHVWNELNPNQGEGK